MLHLNLLFEPIRQVIQKVASFEWGTEQDKDLTRSSLLCKLFCPLGFYHLDSISSSPMVPEVAVAYGDPARKLLTAPLDESLHRPLNCNQDNVILLGNNFPFGLLLDLDANKD